jgi:hypothetical protein
LAQTLVADVSRLKALPVPNVGLNLTYVPTQKFLRKLMLATRLGRIAPEFIQA